MMHLENRTHSSSTNGVVASAPRSVEITYRADGGNASATLRLLVDRPIVVGRDEHCEVRLPSDFVSRQHAVITLSDDSFEVNDVSSNGTLAGDVVLRRRAVEVAYGTPIGVGEFTIVVRLAHPEAIAVEEAESGRVERIAPRPAVADRTIRREIHHQLLDYLDLAKLDPAKLEDPSMRPKVLLALRRIMSNFGSRVPDGPERDVLLGELADEALGLGPLEGFLADPAIDEIMVVDANTIYVETSGKVIKTNAYFTDDERVRAVIERIVTP
ncbi:MAG TPA: FHA domain-containing protein, partial [Polyangiaceae bacterium]